jgi:sugar O-acyltransferase (sialic acid O-acetyltransferase NeuD family)
MSKDLVIIGASGHAKDVAWIVESRGDEWNLRGFLDDDLASAGVKLTGRNWLGRIAAWREFADCAFAVAIGAPRVRAKIVAAMTAEGRPRFASLIHAAAHVSSRSKIGQGAMIGPGVTVSVDAQLGAHVIVNAGATIAHDDLIGDFCTIAPQAALSGNVTCEDGVEIGTAASIRQGTRVGRGAMIGMGAVVTRDVAANECVVGNPARFLRKLPPFETTP